METLVFFLKFMGTVCLIVAATLLLSLGVRADNAARWRRTVAWSLSLYMLWQIMQMLHVH